MINRLSKSGESTLASSLHRTIAKMKPTGPHSLPELVVELIELIAE